MDGLMEPGCGPQVYAATCRGLARLSSSAAAALAGGGLALLPGRVPFVDRQRLLFIPHAFEGWIGQRQFEIDRVSLPLLPSDDQYCLRVNRIGQRIAAVAALVPGPPARNLGTAPVPLAARAAVALDHLAGTSWEFHVVRDRSVCGGVYPGRSKAHVVVSSGLIEFLGAESRKTDSDLAMVLSHEVGHCLACHSSERVQLSVLKWTTSLARLWGATLRSPLEADAIGSNIADAAVSWLLHDLALVRPGIRNQEVRDYLLTYVYMRGPENNV